MTLLPEQAEAIRTWLAKGDSLSDVQKQLKETFDLGVTYLDLRMAVMDIGAAVKDKPEPVKKTPPPQQEIPADPTITNAPKSEVMQPPDPTLGEAPDTLVAVSVDTIMVPATAMISGTVVFTDGVKARWYFDRAGRFAFEPSIIGYRPTEADSKAFEQTLQSEIGSRGY